MPIHIFSTLVQEVFSHRDLKKVKCYKPWTKPASEVNHNIDNLYLKQKIQYLKIRQKDKTLKGKKLQSQTALQQNNLKKRWVSIELVMLIMDIERIYFMFMHNMPYIEILWTNINREAHPNMTFPVPLGSGQVKFFWHIPLVWILWLVEIFCYH